jgi:hypothetical protein
LQKRGTEAAALGNGLDADQGQVPVVIRRVVFVHLLEHAVYIPVCLVVHALAHEAKYGLHVGFDAGR